MTWLDPIEEEAQLDAEQEGCIVHVYPADLSAAHSTDFEAMGWCQCDWRAERHGAGLVIIHDRFGTA